MFPTRRYKWHCQSQLIMRHSVNCRALDVSRVLRKLHSLQVQSACFRGTKAHCHIFQYSRYMINIYVGSIQLLRLVDLMWSWIFLCSSWMDDFIMCQGRLSATTVAIICMGFVVLIPREIPYIKFKFWIAHLGLLFSKVDFRSAFPLHQLHMQY